MPPTKTSIDRLERLEQERRPHHVSVLRWQPGRDDPDVLYDQHVVAGLVRDGFGVLVVPSPAATDELFDLALARGDYGTRPSTLTAPDPAPDAPTIEPVAPVPDPWRQALDELQRQLVTRQRHGG